MNRFQARDFLLSSATLALFLSVGGCSSEPGPINGSGGALGTGGSAAGGGNSGGASSGGAPAGGSSSGGARTGGSSSGGAAAGGAAAGGASSGGAAAGGAAAGGAAAGGASTGGGSSGDFTVTSTAFEDGESIPPAHTCEGGGGQMNWGAAPALKWENPPEGTMSYAFFMIDETLTTKQPPDVNGNHSGAWNIPTTITELPDGWTVAANLTGATAINGGYLGPCPNLVTNGNTDKYNLIVLALPEATYSITASGTAGVRDTYAQLKAEALAEAVLSGTSNADNE